MSGLSIPRIIHHILLALRFLLATLTSLLRRPQIHHIPRQLHPRHIIPLPIAPPTHNLAHRARMLRIMERFRTLIPLVLTLPEHHSLPSRSRLRHTPHIVDEREPRTIEECHVVDVYIPKRTGMLGEELLERPAVGGDAAEAEGVQMGAGMDGVDFEKVGGWEFDGAPVPRTTGDLEGLESVEGGEEGDKDVRRSVGEVFTFEEGEGEVRD